ncbi:MAG: hypothetical protein GYA52_07040 [Chloroflexi bacterium]|nr:hypothetical protein [Chloroflexota bacterium]
MKQYQRIQRLAIIVLLFVIGMLIWINQDGTIVDEVYFFPEKNFDLESNLGLVEELNQLKDHYRLRLRYLRRPWYGKNMVVQLKLEEKDPDASVEQAEGLNGTVLFKARMEVASALVTPGSTIILPLNLPNEMDIRWNIESKDRQLSNARVWLSIAPADENATLSSFVPLMVLPVDFHFRVILGLSTQGWQWILSGCGVMCVGAIFYCQSRKNKERE